MRAEGQRRCTPQNDDPAVGGTPLLTLSSGYIERSKHLLPKQGSRMPWQVHQSHLRDYRSMRSSELRDEALVFSA